MTLAELRKLSIRKQFKIHFRLRNGMECIVAEDGIAHVPALKGIPDFNLEEELAVASEFLLEPAVVDKKNPVRPRALTRGELAAMTSDAPVSVQAPEHDDE
jgi:hypothetical protein